jgi:hypothetical protein
MTHAEYEKKRIALLTNHLYAAAVADVDLGQAADLARQLADALDRLALEIDPFENIIKRRETR